MSHRLISLFTLCLPVLFLLTGCGSKDQPSIPVTGADDISVPATVNLTHENVLEYVISSSRLASVPPRTDWQLDPREMPDGEYRFHNGNWLMVIWLTDTDDEKQRVVIINIAEDISWCGFVTSDGRVVDTCYTR